MKTESNIATAQSEYYRRPKDERFASVAALVEAAQHDKETSKERTYNLKDLRAVVETPAGNDPTKFHTDDDTQTIPENVLRLESPNGRAQFTHYSFGQLARTIGAPAGYLRTLPPGIAADCLNHGLQATPYGTTANLLVRGNGGTPVIRAATSDTYGRVWDANLYGELMRRFMDTDARWQTPPTWDGEPAGAYRGDRDSFVIVVNGGSIVTDPSLTTQAYTGVGASGQQPTDGSNGMYRGLMIRNSEVGHCSITIESILFRYICGNHMLWGAIMDRQFRRRHVGTKITRDTMREINDLAWKFTNRSASRDEAIVKGLIEHEIALTKEAVIDELRKMGATATQAAEAYATCEETESASPRSFWGVSQGLTRNAQTSGYQDDRLALDQLAALVMKRGAALLTV